MSAYRGILNQNSRATCARYLLGICELQRGNLPAGIRQLEQVRWEDPIHGKRLTLSSRHTLASLTWTRPSGFSRPTCVVTSAPRATSCAGLTQWPAVTTLAPVSALEAALKLGPKLPGVRSMLGVTLCLANRLNDAIPVLESALQENPQDNNAAAFLGWPYKERNRPGDALALLSQTVAARPDDHRALFLLAQLTQARGEPAAAWPCWKRWWRRSPNIGAPMSCWRGSISSCGARRTQHASGRRSSVSIVKCQPLSPCANGRC